MSYIVSLAAAALLAAGGAAHAEGAKLLIEKGDAHARAFDDERAVAEYERALALVPNDPDTLARLARSCRDAGERLAAEGRKAEARSLFERGARYAEALKAASPDRADGHYYAATNYGHLARSSGARARVRLSREVERNAKRAIELDPAFAPPYVTLGVYYREVAGASGLEKAIARTFLGGLPDGTYEDSERMLRRAVELAPADVGARFELALTYERMKQRERAAEELRKVLELPVSAHRDARLKAEAERRLAAAGGR